MVKQTITIIITVEIQVVVAILTTMTFASYISFFEWNAKPFYTFEFSSTCFNLQLVEICCSLVR